MNEKPFYKKWWVWVIAAFILINMPKLFSKEHRTTQPPPPQISEKFRAMSPEEHLSNAKKSLELNNLTATKQHLDAIPKESPESAEVELLREKIANQEVENRLTSDELMLKNMDKKLNEQRAKLRKYYCSVDDVKGLRQDIIQLQIVKDTYEKGKGDKEKRLLSKATSLLPKAESTLREVYASSVEEIFVRRGMDVRVRSVGNGNSTLRITFALMSRPLIYQFQNEIKLDEQARSIGFTKLVYTNGFESDLGETWTVNLK